MLLLVRLSGNWLADDAPCAEIFDAAMHEALGSPQTCVWSQDDASFGVSACCVAWCCWVVSGPRYSVLLFVGSPRAGRTSQWLRCIRRIKACFVYMGSWDLGATATLLLGENVTTGVNTVVPAGQIRRFSSDMGWQEQDIVANSQDRPELMGMNTVRSS